ncbi:hypothetical protein [Hymenobacter convexus]|uniref:hypothetical protein n=1 Tax=Hymenobacter sp. CA1UV-4 TaxID=3063782 RepID=UPI002713C346|nr:hypothetical protein [Hymenobacter sp. CA1UV-4]MDO7850563.1 hypothetical protein [Hymenobacter sp. CA1UV-4]
MENTTDESTAAQILSPLVSFYRFAEKLLGSRFWQIQVVILCVVMAGVMQTPRYQYYYRYAIAKSGENHIFTALDKQVSEPLGSTNFAPESHQSKMAFRLLVPLLLKGLHIPSAGYLGLQFVFGLLMLYALTKLLHDITQDRLATALLLLGLSCTYFGCAYLTDVLTLLDAFSYALLVFMMLFRSPLVLAPLMVLGAFNDERTIVAIPIVMLWHACRNSDLLHEKSWGLLLKRVVANPQVLALLLGIGLYVAIRLSLASVFHLKTVDGYVGFSALALNALAGTLDTALFSGLESFWVILVASLLLLLSLRAYRLLLLLLLALMPIFLGSFLVFDVTRSISYGTPVFLLSLYLLRPYLTRVNLRHLAAVVMFGAVFIPTTSVMCTAMPLPSAFNFIIYKVFAKSAQGMQPPTD